MSDEPFRVSIAVFVTDGMAKRAAIGSVTRQKAEERRNPSERVASVNRPGTPSIAARKFSVL